MSSSCWDISFPRSQISDSRNLRKPGERQEAASGIIFSAPGSPSSVGDAAPPSGENGCFRSVLSSRRSRMAPAFLTNHQSKTGRSRPAGGSANESNQRLEIRLDMHRRTGHAHKHTGLRGRPRRNFASLSNQRATDTSSFPHQSDFI